MKVIACDHKEVEGRSIKLEDKWLRKLPDSFRVTEGQMLA
ncbi:hypothetical protein GCM10009001_08920 [Virgibacillus siamensis]|uniref:Uncharacterized protein n=1 Tax=Virgibacillus siamensis TaxID=480071 RepID=A0ABN1FPR7_9BACI